MELSWRVKIGCGLLPCIWLLGCEPTPINELKAPINDSVAVPAAKIVLIQANNQKIELAQNQICTTEDCTRFDIQNIKTNVDWINEYFLHRLHQMEPSAFEKYQVPENERIRVGDLGLNQSTLHVRYLAQNEHLATFVIQSYSYRAGAAHGMYHHEYVNFDLEQKQRFGLKELIQKDKKRAFLDALYDANMTWLMDHQITRDQLKLSDNFYYGTQGIVFVYPLYELASYGEGMSELVLPYAKAKELVQATYLPTLPDYDLP